MSLLAIIHHFLFLFMRQLLEENYEIYQVLSKFLNSLATDFIVSKQIFFFIYFKWCVRSLGGLKGSILSQLDLSPTSLITVIFLLVQRKMEIFCRTFAILTLPCCIILDNKMLAITRKGMFQRGIIYGRQCFWCSSDF